MAPAPESTPHANTVVYSSTYEGAQPIAEFNLDNSIDAVTRQILPGPRLLQSWTETQVSLLLRLKDTAIDRSWAIAGVNMKTPRQQLQPQHRVADMKG